MSTSSQNILVTGGAGYIGSHACKALKNSGFVPVTIDNLSRGHREAVKWGPFEETDLHDKTKLLSLFKKYQPQAVLHFAGYSYVGESVSRPLDYYQNNVMGSLSLLEAMKESQCKNIIFSSTCAVYGHPKKVPISEEELLKPISPYGHTKKMVEDILSIYDHAYGLKFISLRYFNAAGSDSHGEIGENHDPETHVIPLCLQAALDQTKEFSIFGTDYPTDDGTCIRDYIHVVDLAQGHITAMEYLEKNKKSDVFNLGTGRGFSVKEILTATEKITGKKIKQKAASRRPGDPPLLIADCTKAIKELSWKPRYTDIESSIEHAWKWHLKNVK